MYATCEGSARYASRFPGSRGVAFYRSVLDLTVSSLGLGTCLGETDDTTDTFYTDAIVAAGEDGVNFFDIAIKYRNRSSGRCIGAALQRLQRDHVVMCTKAGFLVAGAAKCLAP